MKKRIAFGTQLLLVFVCGLPSCKTLSTDYGKRNLRYSNDSTQTVAAKKALNQLSDHDFLALSFKYAANLVLPYRLLTPLTKDPLKKYPLVITLHNSTRIGTDNKNQLEPLARIWLADNIRKKYQAYLLAPQFSRRSTEYSLDAARGILTAKAQPELVAVLELIDSLKKNYPIDEQHIYLVGYSMGASSVINLLNLKPNAFTAAVAIAGVPNFEAVKPLQKVPILLIHGSEDTENPFAGSVQLFKELSPGANVQFWEYTGRTHDNIVSVGLLGDKIPNWLFGK